jgi:hypothetical protein
MAQKELRVLYLHPKAASGRLTSRQLGWGSYTHTHSDTPIPTRLHLFQQGHTFRWCHSLVQGYTNHHRAGGPSSHQIVPPLDRWPWTIWEGRLSKPRSSVYSQLLSQFLPWTPALTSLHGEVIQLQTEINPFCTELVLCFSTAVETLRRTMGHRSKVTQGYSTTGKPIPSQVMAQERCIPRTLCVTCRHWQTFSWSRRLQAALVPVSPLPAVFCHIYHSENGLQWILSSFPEMRSLFTLWVSWIPIASWNVLSKKKKSVKHTHTHTCEHVHTHTFMHVCVHTHIHSCTHVWACAHPHTCTCVDAHTHTHTHEHLHTCEHMHTHILVRTYTHMNTHMWACAYTHTQQQQQQQQQWNASSMCSFLVSSASDTVSTSGPSHLYLYSSHPAITTSTFFTCILEPKTQQLDECGLIWQDWALRPLGPIPFHAPMWPPIYTPGVRLSVLWRHHILDTESLHCPHCLVGSRLACGLPLLLWDLLGALPWCLSWRSQLLWLQSFILCRLALPHWCSLSPSLLPTLPPCSVDRNLQKSRPCMHFQNTSDSVLHIYEHNNYMWNE